MGNTADLAMVQKTIIDTLHKEGKSQRGITERGGSSQSAVSKHIYIYIYAFSRRFYPKRLTLHSSYSFYILSALAFPGNRTHDLGIVSAMLYQLSYRKAKLTGRKKFDRKRCTSNRDDCKLENTVKQSRFKHLGELHKQ